MPRSRQLAAIMFTDIVGYTALMGKDEQKAFETLNKNRQIQKPLIEQHNGRWIKEIGDGVLASFSSISDAVAAAINIQEICRSTEDFRLRIGIHLGEVTFENNDVFGDGVNIAARIQAIAPPGSIYVSDSVQQNLSNKKGFRIQFVGEENLKNVKEPTRIFEVLPETTRLTADPSPSFASPAVTPPAKSIAVMPFVNMSNDSEQDFFCDGVAEEIMNALVQLNNLRVIARTSAFAFKGKNLDVRQIGKMLEVDTLLEGSVRKAGNRLRIITKMVNTADGSQLWSNRYDSELEDVFAIQENIAESVATALQGVLTQKEKASIRRPETSVQAYEYYLKGRQLFHELVLQKAKSCFDKAISFDPHYALAYTGLADTHSWLYEWEGADEIDLQAAEENSKKALALAPELSESHSSRGFVLSLAKQYEEAEAEFKEAIRLNANNFEAYYYLGRSSFARGRIPESAHWFRKAAEVRREDFQSALLLAQSLRVLKLPSADAAMEGIKRARKHLQLFPTDQRALSLGAGNLWDIGEKEEAVQWINKALELYPEETGVLVNGACFFAKAGNKEKALDLLEKVFGKGFGKRNWIEQDPDYDSLREDARFQALLQKLK